MKFKPTSQQLNCMELARTEMNILISALAGTGKTQTLVMIAEDLDEGTLLLTFNKAAQVDAERRFPDFVHCKTTHGLAYNVFGRDIAHKLKRPRGGYVNVAGTGAEIARYYKISDIHGSKAGKSKKVSASFIGALVRRTLSIFENSASTNIETFHVPDVRELAQQRGIDAENLVSIILQTAKSLWVERCDSSSKVLATHDTYLKMYQLSKPILGYPVVMLDEAQDTTNCVIDIILNQVGHSKVIVVGDENQQMYQWKGSVNALSKFERKNGSSVKWHKAELTKSFRFGQEVSNIANAILGRDDITSLETLVTEVGEVDTNKPYSKIFRTNINLIMNALDLIRKGIPVDVKIDVTGFVKKLEACQHLYRGDLKKVKHEDITAFESWQELKEESEDSVELKYFASLVESDKASSVMYFLKSNKDRLSEQRPQIIFTTAHKAKGLEYDQVILADDFKSIYDKEGNWVGLDEAETCIMYVAATRARERLQINKTVKEIIERCEGEDIAFKKRITSEIKDLEKDYQI